jgi:putative flippase GtrA
MLKGKMGNFLRRIHDKYPLQAEIFRFLLVGGLATVTDFLVMALMQFLLEPSLYATFWDIFTAKSTGYVNILGTAAGFCAGLLVNYFLSVIFVFEEKGKSKTAYGFVVFALLSLVGLGIHVFGMWLFNSILQINPWIVKIVLTIVVLVWNYLSRKFILFRKDK